MTHKVDPKITVADALAIHNGNQSALANDLDLSRSVVCEWVANEREFVPPLHAHRLVAMYPKLKKKRTKTQN